MMPLNILLFHVYITYRVIMSSIEQVKYIRETGIPLLSYQLT